MADRAGAIGPEVLSLVLAEDVRNDRQRLLLDAAKVVAPLEALRVALVDIFRCSGSTSESTGVRPTVTLRLHEKTHRPNRVLQTKRRFDGD